MKPIPILWKRILALAVLIALFVAVDAWQRTRPEDQRWDSLFSLWSPIIGPGNEDPEPAENATTPAPTPASTPDYGEALNDYGDVRVQLSECNGTPGRMNVKRGTTVMIDNRDDEARAVTVGSTAMNVGAYGFALYTANQVGELNVTCDGGGAATLNVQP